MVLGGLILFDPSVPNAAVSPSLIALIAGLLVLFFGFVVRAALRARHLPPGVGLEGMVGEKGVAVADLDPEGQVRARHETWTAESVGPAIPEGSPVRIVRVAGLRLIVAPADSGEQQLTGQGAAGREGGA